MKNMTIDISKMTDAEVVAVCRAAIEDDQQVECECGEYDPGHGKRDPQSHGIFCEGVDHCPLCGKELVIKSHLHLPYAPPDDD